MAFLLSFFGVAALLLRVWLTEVKLRDILGTKRFHLSRFCSYFLLLAMIWSFQNSVFLLITIYSAPAMLISFFIFDVPFLIRDVPQITLHRGWQIIERLTVHIPIVIYGVYYYFTAPLLMYFQMLTIVNFCLGIAFTAIPLIVLDPRIRKREDWPRGPALLIGMVLAILGNLAFYVYKAVEVNYIDQVIQIFFLKA
ncbi:MAG: hypothetical protein ACTSWW_07650 [Promethearchaeota archaeon]